MKNRNLLVFLILFGYAAQAQITLEHIYPYPGVNRVLVPGLGECYFAVIADTSTDTGTVHWFNGSHQSIGEANFSMPANVTMVYVFYSSTDFLDSDPGIEFGILWFTTSGSLASRVLDDDGTILTEDYDGVPTFFTVNNINKLQVADKIYAVPGFNIDHTFPTSDVGFIYPENEGRKFWYLAGNGDIILLNDDYSAYKTLSVDFNPPTDCIYNLLFHGKHQFNTDENLELSYSYRCPNSFTLRYYSEEDQLFEFQSQVANFYYNQTLTTMDFPALNGPKTLIHYGSDSIQTYDVLSGIKEHTFLGPWQVAASDISGLIYIPSAPDVAGISIPLLDQYYNNWATFPKDAGDYLVVKAVNEHFFDADGNTKEIFGSSFLPTGEVKYRIWRPDGTTIFELQTTLQSSTISVIPGLNNKLLFYNPDFPQNLPHETHVYSLPTSTPASVLESRATAALDFTAFPNPTEDAIHLDFSRLNEPVEEIWIYDITGQSRYHHNTTIAGSVFEVPALPFLLQGIYFVQIRSGRHTGIQKVVRQ